MRVNPEFFFQEIHTLIREGGGIKRIRGTCLAFVRQCFFYNDALLHYKKIVRGR